MSRFGVGFTGGLAGGNDQYTKILLHTDGTNGGTSFPDANLGGSAHTWSASGGAITSNAVAAKFGATSLRNTGGYITTPDSSDFTLGSGDFTVDFWFLGIILADIASKNVMGQVTSAGTVAASSLAFFTDASGRIQFNACVGSTATAVTSTTALNTGSWIHVAAVRQGNFLKLYVNGVQEGGSVAISGSVNDSSGGWSIGRWGDVAGFSPQCFIDEFRLSVGIARWTANFTPPTLAYF